MQLPLVSRYALLSRRIAGHLLAGTLASFFLANSLSLLSSQAPNLFLLDEAGYGDSYVLYDVLHFRDTGEIYRDLSQSPYLPAQYSPLMYIVYSLPGRAIASENPFLGPRFIALAAFLSCLAVVVSIVRVLVPVRYAWAWGLLLAASVISFHDWQNWIISVRGDFPGIVFSLLTLRLLLARSPRAVLPAGLCAGLAVQFKITLVTALAAGFLWLLFRKRWRELAVFATAGTLSSAGPYLFFWAREPRMLSQMTAVVPGIKDLPGLLKLSFKAIREPVALLALLALPPVGTRFGQRWTLLFLFACISFVIAEVAAVQAGANINYFFEALLALVPAAVLGILRLIHWARQRIGVAAFLSAVILFHFLPPTVLDLYQMLWLQSPSREVERWNDQFRKARNVLGGYHIFSTAPRLALLDPAPALTEPYLMSYLQQIGKFDPQPILERIRNMEFDVVITPARRVSWRGVPHIAPDLRHAIEGSYVPQCMTFGALVQVPRARPGDDALLQELNRNGCVPLRGVATRPDPSW